jgi:WD40 repeat protein
MIYKLGNQYQGPRVVGVLSKEWEDRLSFIDYHHGHPTTVCHGPDFLAVGLTTGTVTLYHGEFYREHITLQHGESLKFIRFRPNSYIIATCGMKTVKLWDTQTAELLHCAETTQRPMDMTFKNSELFLAGQRNYLDVWDTDSSTTWGSRIKWRNSPDTGLERPRRCPCALAISVDHNVLAVAYTGGPITIWDLKEDAFVGYCGKLLPNGDIISHRVTSLAFNPNPNLSLLAVTYLDGDLAIVDPISNEQFECFRANCQMLAASRNGRFLAAGGSNGTINVYEFDTLKVLYTVKSSNSFIQQLDFSGNSLRIADIRGTQCNVWEPAALLRESFNDDSSGYTSASIVDNVSLAAKAKVTAIDVHPSLDIVICGNDDGAVHIYCRKAAEYLGSLYSHNSSIRHLEWCIERQSILSIDASNQIILCRILQLTTNDWTSNVEIMFKTRIASDKAVISLLIHEDGERLVVSTRGSDHFLSMENLITDHRVERDNPAMCKWITHPASPTHLIRVSSVGLSVYSWLDWSEVSFHGFPIGNHLLELKNLAPFPFGSHPGILIEFSEKYGSSVTNYLASVGIDDVSQLFNIGGTRTGEASSASNIEAHSMVNNQTGDVNELLLLPVATNLQKEIAHMIGITGVGKLVFLDRLSWVSTIDLTRGHDLRSIGMYKRHFFIPNDWFAEGRDIICALSQNEVIFARGRGIAIVKSCFEYEEDVLFENG